MFMANSHDKNSLPGRGLAKNQRQQNSFIIVAHSQILMETCFAMNIKIQSFTSWTIASLWRNNEDNEALDFFCSSSVFVFISICSWKLIQGIETKDFSDASLWSSHQMSEGNR